MNKFERADILEIIEIEINEERKCCDNFCALNSDNKTACTGRRLHSMSTMMYLNAIYNKVARATSMMIKERTEG